MTIAEPPAPSAADVPPRPAFGAASPAELLGPLAEEVRLLVQQELALARAELALNGRHAARAGAAAVVAAVVGGLALAAVAGAAGLALAQVLPAPLAFLLLGVALAAAAGAALRVARRHRQAISPLPRRTIDNVKEDVAWLRAQLG